MLGFVSSLILQNIISILLKDITENVLVDTIVMTIPCGNFGNN